MSVTDQIKLLSDRGMEIHDADEAKHYLSHINYYRLRAYWLPFEAPNQNGGHQFRPGTKFTDVIAVYQFDRELRLLLMDVIERIEISLRAQWANQLSINYKNALAHENSSLFKEEWIWERGYKELKKELQNSREIFAEHYQRNYDHLKTAPIWVCCELMSIGNLSRWIANLKKPRDRQNIADTYQLDEKELVSFLHHLTIVRNHCAHHGRIWNREITVKMALPKKKPKELISVFNRNRDALARLYNTLAMLNFLLSIVSPASQWSSKLIDLLDERPLQAMGFPENWRTMQFWG